MTLSHFIMIPLIFWLPWTVFFFFFSFFLHQFAYIRCGWFLGEMREIYNLSSVYHFITFPVPVNDLMAHFYSYRHHALSFSGVRFLRGIISGGSSSSSSRNLVLGGGLQVWRDMGGRESSERAGETESGGSISLFAYCRTCHSFWKSSIQLV